jgi:hypothetical protein
LGTLLDISGQRFSRLTVIARAPSVKGHTQWLCRCDCGAERSVGSNDLRSGHTRSCGCWSRDEVRVRLTTHGMTGHPAFSKWKGMLSRCSNQNTAGWKNYGGRGIAVCERWLSFENFWADMGSTWAAGLTIERDDNDKGYSPDNCRWLPKSQQSRNRRSTTFIDSPWGRLTIAEVARKCGVSWFAMRARVQRDWPPERMFLGPTGRGGRKRCESPSMEDFTKLGR